jgi:hypothetical protein
MHLLLRSIGSKLPHRAVAHAQGHMHPFTVAADHAADGVYSCSTMALNLVMGLRHRPT